MELSPFANKGDRRQNDDKGRLARKAVNSWFNPSATESSPKRPPEPEQRMPVSFVTPESDDGYSYMMPHEAALHSGVWLSGQVRPPEGNMASSTSFESPHSKHENAENQEPLSGEFQHLLERAGLEELNRPHEEAAKKPSAQPVEQYRVSRRANLSPRTRALIARAAGMMTAMHLRQEQARPELLRTLRKIDERMDVEEARQRGGSRTSATFESPFNRQPVAPVERQSRTEEGAGTDEPDPFNIKPEEHVEHDAWHNIVVDKFGHEDVNARMQYGKAFRQEQREVQQSALSDTTPVTQSSGATPVASEVPEPVQVLQYTNSAPMLSGSVPEPQLPAPAPQMPSLPDGISRPQLPTGIPLREDPQHLLPKPAPAKAKLSFIVNPWAWLVAGLIILVFFIASLIG